MKIPSNQEILFRGAQKTSLIPSRNKPMALETTTRKKTPKVKYSAMFLKDNSPLLELLKKHQIEIPTDWTIHAHHSTIEFKPQSDFPTLEGTLTVTEIRKQAGCVYALVEPPETIIRWVKSRNMEMPPWHITIATAPQVEPKLARQLAKELSGGEVWQLSEPLAMLFRSGGFLFKGQHGDVIAWSLEHLGIDQKLQTIKTLTCREDILRRLKTALEKWGLRLIKREIR
jgi:hypothetical protein